jgi:catechol 2,3-dioxygenase-like lactoylglutathione lyase family enzyme
MRRSTTDGCREASLAMPPSGRAGATARPSAPPADNAEIESCRVNVEQVDFITIPTRNAKRAVEFYRDVLGLPVSEFSDGEVETPNVTLGFWNPEEQGIEFKPNEAGFAIRVTDVAEARRELEAKGVEFMGDTFDSSVCHMGFFKDPDGNVVILHRRYAPRVAR